MKEYRRTCPVGERFVVVVAMFCVWKQNTKKFFKKPECETELNHREEKSSVPVPLAVGFAVESSEFSGLMGLGAHLTR